MNTKDKLYLMSQIDKDNANAVAGYVAERKAETIAKARRTRDGVETQPVLSRTEGQELKRLFKEQAVAERELARMEKRRDELATRPVLCEQRRQRFLRRLDAEIAEARRRRTEAMHAINIYQGELCSS